VAATRPDVRSGRSDDEVVVGESRWPMATAVVAAVILTELLPDELRAGPQFVLPVIAGLLLVGVVLGDPGKIDRTSHRLRMLSILLVSILVFGALWATVQLVDDLIHGSELTNSASKLLEVGFVVWLLNIVSFALLYWELDGGGAAARAHRIPTHPDLAFPQQLNPELAPADWRPIFIDYLYLAFTTATALSPTDTMPLVPWSKITMAFQSAISIVVLGLIVARAVNAFT
jgi:hypothetical protein